MSQKKNSCSFGQWGGGPVQILFDFFASAIHFLTGSTSVDVGNKGGSSHKGEYLKIHGKCTFWIESLSYKKTLWCVIFGAKKVKKMPKLRACAGGGDLSNFQKNKFCFFSVTSSLGHEITILFYSSYLTVPVISSARIWFAAAWSKIVSFGWFGGRSWVES